MGKKSKKKSNNKKGKESDGRGSSTGGGSNNNNRNNNISIPMLDDETVVETTTMVLTPNQIDEIDRKYQLAGYPKSNYFVDGYRARKANKDDLAADTFKRGATEVSCVPSMVGYGELQRERGNVHLSVPFYIEAAIRGHTGSIGRLTGLYEQAKPKIARALVSLWTKMKIDFGASTYTEESWKELQKNDAKICVVCDKEESEDNNDVTLVQCGKCRYYSYCGKKCQTYHWQEGKHMHECHQVLLLRKYCQPQYVQEIREAIIRGQDSKEIHTLQQLRTELGLNRPKEDYEELLLRLSDDNNNNNNNNNIMKQGTKVQIKGLVKASVHNGKFGFVTTKVSSPEEAGGSSRVGVELVSDDSGTVLNVKIENLEICPNPFEYLVARKDGTVHIGSTPSLTNIHVPDSVQQDNRKTTCQTDGTATMTGTNMISFDPDQKALIARMGPEQLLQQANRIREAAATRARLRDNLPRVDGATREQVQKAARAKAKKWAEDQKKK